jgi:hypothetical protein
MSYRRYSSFNVLDAPIGIFIDPKPPSDLGMFTQARWLKRESQLAAITWVLIAKNSGKRSPKAMISVGQTNL